MQTNTLEKIKSLEAYLTIDSVFVDSVLDKSITKLVMRKQIRMQHLKQRLQQQLSQFEQNYNYFIVATIREKWEMKWILSNGHLR